MATRSWRGGAQLRAQVDTVTISHVEVGVILTLTHGGKSVTSTATTTNTTTEMAALAAAWNAAIDPQFTEITALASGASITLTADNEGVPFTLTATQTGTGGNSEVKTVTISNSPTGGTWSWIDATYGTVSGLAYNITGANLQTALETPYGVGNVTVTGNGPYTVTFGGTLAHVDIPTITFTSTTLTGGNATVAVTTTTQGSAGTSEVQTITFYGTPTGGTFAVTFNGFTTAALAYNISAANLQTALEGLSSIGTGNITVAGAAGGPYTCTFAGSLASTAVALMTVDAALLTGGTIFGAIATTTPGVAGVNETQYVTLRIYTGTESNQQHRITRTGTVSGGTFTLSIREPTESAGAATATAAIAYNATMYEIIAALETAASTHAGSEYNGPWFAAYTAAYANYTISGINPLIFQCIGARGNGNDVVITLNGASLTGGGSYAIASFAGSGTSSGAGETTPDSGAFTLTFGGQTTAALTYTAPIEGGDATTTPTAAQVQTALEGLSSIGTGNVSVEAFDTNTVLNDLLEAKGMFIVTFQGTLAGTPLSSITAAVTDQGGHAKTWDMPVYTIKNGQAGTSEVQTLTLSGTPANGSFTLTYGGQTTAAIAYNANAAAVDSALEALGTIPAGAVLCAGGALPGTPVTITFTGSLQYTDVEELVIDDTSLKVIVTETTPGVTATNEVQTISLSGSPHGGTATLTYSGQTTAGIAYNATAGTIQTALEALSNLAPGDVTLTGGPWPASVTVTFGGTLAATNVAEMTGSGTGLNNGLVTETSVGPIIYTTTTTNSGPNDWNVTDNWSGTTLPVTGDTVYIDQGDVPILYGLDQSSVILVDLQIAARFTAEIGLPLKNESFGDEYFEFRQQYLKIGSPSIGIGYGDGNGSGRIKLDLTPSTTPTINVYCTNTPLEDGVEACLLLTPAGSILNATQGSIGVAVFAGETSTVVTTRVGFETNQSGDVTVQFGSGVTWTTIEMSGGQITTNSAGTTVTMTGGEYIHKAGALTTANIDGGDLRYNSTGTLTTANVGGGGNLDFRQDLRAKTVTNVSLYEGSEWHDPHGIVTATNGIDFVRCTPADTVFEVKPNQTWTPSSI